MRKEDACGSDCGCESPLKTGQHRNINNAQYTKGAKNPEKLHATASAGRSSRSREILKNPVFMRVLRRGKTYENPRKRTHSTREIHR